MPVTCPRSFTLGGEKMREVEAGGGLADVHALW